VEQLTFVKLAETSDIPAGQMKAVRFEEKELLIANVSGSYYAMGNRCTHSGGDLSKGRLDGTTVTCHYLFFCFFSLCFLACFSH
jgi:3-phenylpropionate/trans-cinnamate dioxygenase ferredoxin subunit